MKFTAFIATAILAYTTAVVAIPLEATTTAAAIVPTGTPVVDTANVVDYDDDFEEDFDDEMFDEEDFIVKRDAEAEPRRVPWWLQRSWRRPIRYRYFDKDNGWNSRPGQAKRDVMPDAAPEARGRRYRYFDKDNGWNSRPGQAKRDASPEAEARGRRYRYFDKDNGWNSRPGQA